MADFITKIHELPIASDRAKADIAGNSIVDTYATKTEGSKVSTSEGAESGYLSDVLKAGDGITLTEKDGVISASSGYSIAMSLTDFKATRPILYKRTSSVLPNLFSFYIIHNSLWLATLASQVITDTTEQVKVYMQNLSSPVSEGIPDYMVRAIRCARVWSSETDWSVVIYDLKSNAYSWTRISRTNQMIYDDTYTFTTYNDTLNLDLESAYKVDFIPIYWVNSFDSSKYWIGPTEADTSTTSDSTELNPEQGSTELS